MSNYCCRYIGSGSVWISHVAIIQIIMSAKRMILKTCLLLFPLIALSSFSFSSSDNMFIYVLREKFIILRKVAEV